MLEHEIEIIYDTTMPDGTYLKRLDTKKINKLGWYAKTSLEEGIQKTLNYCLEKIYFADNMLSVVIPIFNESQNIEILAKKLKKLTQLQI